MFSSFRLRSWSALASVSFAIMFLSGCASGGIRSSDLCGLVGSCVTVVIPPAMVPAGGFRQVTVEPGTGAGARELATQFKGRLASVLVDGTPYYQFVVAGAALPEARFEVSSQVWEVNDSGVTKTRFRCLDKKCENKQDYTVSCTLRKATVGIQVLLKDNQHTELGRQLSSANAEHTQCQGDSTGMVSRTEVLRVAGNKAFAIVEDALTVRTLRKRVRMMHEDPEIQDPVRRQRFSAAAEFMKAGRMDRACPVFEELADIEAKSVAVFYNLGFCAQALGNWRDAFKWYSKADANAGKPLDELAAALEETRPYALQAR